MSLEDVAERIARTSRDWHELHADPGKRRWEGRHRANTQHMTLGEMVLTDDVLVVRDYARAWLNSDNRAPGGTYSLTESPMFVPGPGDAEPTPATSLWPPFEGCAVQFFGSDHVTTHGEPSRLLLHWLALALAE